MDSPDSDRALPRPGFPIRRSPDQRLLSGFPELIAASHVLRRLLAPRHPPCALSSLTMFATGRRTDVQTQRLGELPRACSQLTDYPSRLSKIDRHNGRLQHGSTARSPMRSGESHRAARCARCGADGDRTHDLRLAKPALSQLSYIPLSSPRARAAAVGVLGFEPRTSALSELRSSQLSYTRSC